MPGTGDILAANLARLRRVEPELADRIAAAEPAKLAWSEAKTGLMSATVEHTSGGGAKPLTLASRFDPIAEANKLIANVDFTRHGGIFVLGLGLGYHVLEIVRKMSKDALLVVFEPNVSLLRGVLERVDHASWLGCANAILCDGTMDRAALTRRVERYAAIVTQGTVIVTHPVTRQMATAEVNGFGQIIADVLSYFRTNVATSLVNSTRTIGNLTLNLAYYTAGANSNELYNAAKGYPAVCVGAGPSLAKNVHLLADPAVRKNVIVISAQTTLKPLLERGIRPDFVTALDYHEISKRFYEGLPILHDVTLVAEAKSNPAIIDSFPGPLRVTHNAFLDRMLGDLAQPMVPIKGGATVAHLSFYLAQHLGCDPIMMIGQDLGFSDGLYYCPGTAIHDVWAPELGPFNTLEMMEWQRIVRHRNHLQEARDVHGRSIYTDEQMLTYLKHFERDFATATQKILDCTEGGMPKQHTTRVPLADALAQYATRPVPGVPLPSRDLDPRKLSATEKLLRLRMDEVTEIRQTTQKTVPILRQMLEHQRDRIRMDKLFADLDRNRAKVEKLSVAFGLVNDLNSIGAFKRARIDRAIEHAGGSEAEQQQKRIERDLENLDWLIQSCDEALAIFRKALVRLDECRKKHGKKEGKSQEAGGRRGVDAGAAAPVAV